MSSELASLGYKIDSSGLLTADRRLQSMTKSGAVAEGGIGKLSGSFASLRGAIGLAAAAMTAFSTGSFVKDNIFSFDKAMTGLKATTRATSAEMAAYEKQARLLGATSQFSATQAGEAQRFLAMAGFESNEILSATPQILKLASAAEIGLAQAADIASNALGGLQLPVDQLSRVMDVMAEAAASSNTDITQLAQALKTSAPIATAAGVEIEELAAVIGALSDSGLQAERAGTGLGGIIRQLSNVVPEAEKVWSKYGITVDDLSISNRGLTNVLKTVRDANLNAGDAIKVFGSEAAAAGLIASAFSDHVEDLTKKYKNSSGAASDMAKIMNGSLSAAALGLGSVFAELALMTGDAGLSGAMKSTIVAATGLLHVYTGMLPEFAAANDLTSSYVNALESAASAAEAFTSVLAVGLAASLVKSAAGFVSVLASTVAYNIQLARMSGLTGAYAVQAGIATIATHAFGVALKVAMWPWGLLLAAVGAAATVFMTSSNDSDTLTKSITNQKNAVTELEKSYKNNTATQLTNTLVKSNAANLELLYKRYEIESKLNAFGAKATQSKEYRDSLKKDLAETNALIAKTGAAVPAATNQLNKMFEDGMDAIQWTDGLKPAKVNVIELTKEFIAWRDSIEGFQTPMQKLKSDLSDITTALANGTLRMTDGTRESILDLENQIESMNASARGNDYEQWISSIVSSVGELDRIKKEIEDVKNAMSLGNLSESQGLEYIDSLQDRMEALGRSASNPFDQIASGANQAASAMSMMFESGSKDAKKMGVAMAALNLIAGVGAILTQGKGDSYSAFGRMAAMASLVASLGVAVGGLGGSFDDTAKANQEAQGLNVWGEKSESISNAVELTASATEKLVGINTKMLTALQGLQAGISAAAGIVYRDSKGANYSYQSNVKENAFDFMTNDFGIFGDGLMKTFTDFFSGAWGFNTIGKLFGGSSKVTDTGIKILGGTLADMIDGASVFAYQEVQSKKYAWSKKKKNTELVELDDASAQFELVFQSLADSVYEGGVALGLSGTELEKAINDFKIEDIKISLKDLSIEDQQKEIEAVFSKIFDDLAGSVIPFIDKFQQTGEGLGETLARVATQVAVADEAALRFGITFGDKLANPEAYAQATDNLSMLAGGVDELAEKVVSFTKFADDATQLEIAGNDLTRALSAVGLSLPDSTLGMWNLMQSLDGTTDAGQEQIATLLNLQDSASSYYSLLESENEQYVTLSSSLRGIISNVYGLSKAAASVALDSALAGARVGEFSAALAGNFSSAMPEIGDFSSLTDFMFEQAVTANKLEELASLSDSQISIDERQLSELEKINQSIRESFTATNESSDGITSSANAENLSKMQTDINTLTRTMSRMQEQANDALDRIANGVTTVRIEA